MKTIIPEMFLGNIATHSNRLHRSLRCTQTTVPKNCPQIGRPTLLTTRHCTVRVFVQSRGACGSRSQITGTRNGGRGCGVLSGTGLGTGPVSKNARVAGRRASARDGMRRIGQRRFVGTVLFSSPVAAFAQANLQDDATRSPLTPRPLVQRQSPQLSCQLVRRRTGTPFPASRTGASMFCLAL